MTKPSDNSFNQTSCRAVEEKSNAHERVLMEWSTKTIKSPPKEIMKAQLWLFAGATLMNIFVTAITWNNLPQYMFGLFSAYVFSYALTIYFILILRQKTVFNYSITANHGKVEYFRNHPESSGTIFKSLAIFIILFFSGVAIYTGSLAFMIGPAAMTLGAAKFLLGWKNNITNSRSSPWAEYNFVTVDRSRLMIVTHRTNQSVGFEARFQETATFDRYLKILKTVLPSSAIYTEKSWQW